MEQAIQQFKTDLSNSASMTDQKDAVGFLTARVGAEKAREIAAQFGLTSSYYFA